MKLFPEAVSLKAVPGKSFVFLTFPNHDSAARAILSAKQVPIQYQDKTLLVGWAEAQKQVSSSAQQLLLTEPPNEECCTLFLGGLPSSASVFSANDLETLLAGKGVVSVRRADGKDFAFVEFRSHEDARELIDSEVPLVLPSAAGYGEITVGWAKGRPAEKSSTHDGDCWFCLGSPSLKVPVFPSFISFLDG